MLHHATLIMYVVGNNYHQTARILYAGGSTVHMHINSYMYVYREADPVRFGAWSLTQE